MNETYELWDTASSNLIGTYPTETAALRVVTAAVAHLGESALATVALGREDGDGKLVPVATGPALAALVRPHLPL